MANFNELNRPQQSVQLGTLEATTTAAVIYAHKKLLLHDLRVISTTAIAASTANYFTLRVRTLNSAGTFSDILGTSADVDTQGGVAVGRSLVVFTDGAAEIDAGTTLLLRFTETGTATWTAPLIALDYEVVGN